MQTQVVGIVDELLSLFGGRAQPLISHLIETGRLSIEDIDEARKALDERAPPVKRTVDKE